MTGAAVVALDDFLADVGRRLDAALDRWLPRSEDAGDLADAMRHIVFSGGKRLRPALVELGCIDVGGDPADALGAAAAVEVLHAYSLVHDDLPCMDDARLRRGRPCVHVVHGEALGVLAGDALLTLAFELLVRGTPPVRPVGVMVRRLAEAGGWEGMVGGQVADLAAAGGAVGGVEAVRAIHLRKTAALIAASLELGALAGGGDPGDVERLARGGITLGLAFQVVDDLLDVESSPEVTGKDSGADAHHDKATWPAVVGVERAREDAGRLVTRARAELAGGRAEGLLAALAHRVLRRRS